MGTFGCVHYALYVGNVPLCQLEKPTGTYIPSAKAVVSPSWAINAASPHVSKWSYKIPIALGETQTRALPLAKMQAF